MADRRTDDAPLAPRRSLGGRTQTDEESAPDNRPPADQHAATVDSGSEEKTAPEIDAGEATQVTAPPTPTMPSAPSAPSGSSGSSGSSEPPGGATSLVDPAKRTPSGSGSGATGARPGRTPARPRRTRKARLRLTHVDPWSVMKIAFLLSIALGIVTVVAVAVVWSVLDAAGVWESINDTVEDVLGSESGSTFDIETYVGTSRVMGFTMIVAVVDVILITAIATLGAFLYNLSAALLGGLEVTLAEDER